MYKTVSEIRKANEALGHHFFQHDWMSSVADETVYYGQYFITADWLSVGTMEVPKAFTIRKVDPDGGINTWGKFRGYETLEEAQIAVKGIS